MGDPIHDHCDHVSIGLIGGGFATIHADDRGLVAEYRWRRGDWKSGIYAYAVINRRWTYMHRLILSAPDNLKVDHINRDTLNNCRINLRLATDSQNGANRIGVPGTSSRYKGVAFDANKGAWLAQIEVNRALRYLGRFSSEEDAARAYDFAAANAWGEYAKLNFPDEPPTDMWPKRLQRPSGPKPSALVQHQIRLEPEDSRALVAWARARGVEPSKAIREIVHDFLRAC